MRDHVPGFGDHGGTLREELKTMAEKVLMKGNEALAEAAIQAGCHHFFGYPITPQTELAAYMAKRMPKIGGTYLQAESEIAAVNMVLGAAAAGVRAMTSSSSPSAAARASAAFSLHSPITGRRRKPSATVTSRFSFLRRPRCRKWSTSSPTHSIKPTNTACPR